MVESARVWVVNQVEANRVLVACFDSWYSVLVRYASRQIRDLDAAEDLVQDVFVRYYQAIRKDEAIEQPKAWMFCVLRNDISKLQCHRGRQQPLSQSIADHIASEDPLLRDETDSEELLRMMTVLTPRERDVLVLRLACLKYREIADRLGLSMSAVNTFLARAIRKLKKVAKTQEWQSHERAEKHVRETLQ